MTLPVIVGVLIEGLPAVRGRRTRAVQAAFSLAPVASGQKKKTRTTADVLAARAVKS